MRRFIEFSMMLVMAVGVFASAEEAASPAAPAYENYKLIYEKNIFSRTRYTPERERRTNATIRRETVILSLYILRGVAVETQNRLAFVEDQISGQFKRLVAGDQLLNGTIAEIHVDRVVFKEDDQVRDIRVGQEFDRLVSEVERPVEEIVSAEDANVTQAAAPRQTREQPQRPATSQSSRTSQSSQSSQSSQDQSAILQQLLERRRQEMGN